MRVAVARDDLYLLARGNEGVDTWRFDTASSAWSKSSDNLPAWSDASGWNDVSNYSTMRVAVARDDLYLLARGNEGVDTWRFDTASSAWSKSSDNLPAWSDASGWNDVSNYSTMRVAVARDDLYLLARGNEGVDTWRFDTASSAWSKSSDNLPAWSDASGWNDVSNYSTMRVAVARDDLYLLARGNEGVDTWRFDTASSAWSKSSDNLPAWSDASGWNDVSNYSTMRVAVARDDLYLLARGNEGVDTWRFDTASSAWSKSSDNLPAWSDASGWNDVELLDHACGCRTGRSVLARAGKRGGGHLAVGTSK